MRRSTSAIAPRRPCRRSRLRVCLAAALLLAALPASAPAQVRTEIPRDDPGPPFYARIERHAVHTDIAPHSGGWAAIVFYRSPACVPPDFNLLDLFDAPAAFGCALTVDGFEVWRRGPPPADPIPMFARFRGLGDVPIWFVAWPELQAAVADDVLTLPELEALPSLRKGSATFYRENLRPTDGADHPGLSLTAHGTLHDGGAFGLHHTGGEAGIETVLRFYDDGPPARPADPAAQRPARSSCR